MNRNYRKSPRVEVNKTGRSFGGFFTNQYNKLLQKGEEKRNRYGRSQKDYWHYKPIEDQKEK